MPLDQYKTQVLLLHSEQSALDSLSASFNDRYTVHCATSGTEALNIFGETPIHVIISAQNLPGMSGVEALREAKKRSPETVGILLAGPNDKNLEALVGEQEVFQIVRGGISGDDLGKLIDNATRQMRLMALAESANDTRANPDESGEHIIMSTSENGASIITDATGSVPALDPKRVSAAVASGAQAVDVLVLSKDEQFLGTIKESTRGLHHVHTADTLAAAEEALRKHSIGVLLVDAGMVGSNVEKLTVHLRKMSKRLVSIVAGRRDDGEMLMDLINRGKVYRFLLKPVSPGRARLAIEASVKHHLEAPDAAFKTVGGDAAKPAAKKAAAKAAAPAPEPKPAPEPEADSGDQSTLLPDIEIEVPSDRLSGAFDEKDSSLTQTMTGIVASVGESLVRKEPPATDAPGDEGGGGSVVGNPMVLGGIAAAVVVLGVIAYFVLGGEDAPEPLPRETAPTITETTPDFAPETVAEPTPAEEPVAIDNLIAQARELRDAGQIYAPAGNNALETFAAAVGAEPTDENLAAEFADVVAQTLTMGEAAMLEGRVADAVAAIGAVTAADPGNPRLPFLSGQLSQMQLRDYLDTARAAILDSRYEDAGTAIAAARALNPADASGIDVVAAELSEARSAEQVDVVLATAAARLEDGQLLTPANDNARYYYELALSNDPGNPTAESGLRMIASTLVLEARAAIDAGRFGTAETLIRDARNINASSPEVAAAERALTDARQRLEDEQRRQAEQRAAAEREAEQRRLESERQAEAERLAAAAASPVAAAGGTDGQDSAAGEVATVSAAEPTNLPNLPDPGATASTNAAGGGAEPGAAVAISALTRTKYVAPRYPRSAERRNVSGWVDIVFTVKVDGTVTNIEVLDSEPEEVFVSAAVKAVEKWEFEPVIENDRYVEKRAGVRMMFALE